MRVLSRCRFLSVVFAAWLVSCFSSGTDPLFVQVGDQEGLSQNTVHDLLQDRIGFLWVGTQDGLNLYDGYQCRTFFHDSLDDGSISNNWVEALLEDDNGDLWVGTRNGLNRKAWDGVTFRKYLYNSEETIADNWIKSLFAGAGGRIWAGASERTLHCVDAVSHEVRSYVLKFEDDPSDLSLIYVNTMEQGEDGRLWLGSDGLILFDPITGHYEDRSALLGPDFAIGNVEIRHIYKPFGEDGILWVGTLEHGLFRIDLETEKSRNYTADSNDPRSLPTNWTEVIYKDKTGSWWVGTGNALTRFDEETGEFDTYRNNPSNPDSLSGNRVFSILEDRTGVLWVGTASGGLNGYDRKKSVFKHYHSSRGLSYNDVDSLYVDRRGQLWASTFDHRLNQYVEKDDRFIVHNIKVPGSEDVKDIEISSMADDEDGRLWLGTRGQGLLKWDAQSGVVRRYLPDPNQDGGLSGEYVNVLYRDRSNVLWVGAFYNGLNMRVEETDVFVSFVHDKNDPQSISGNTIWSIADGHGSDLWVGTYSGLNRMNRETREFERFQHDPQNPDSLCNNGVGAVLLDRKGRLWVGTDYGLDRMERDRFVHYTESDGLPNRVIYGILEDSEGRIWLSTNKGLARLNPETGDVRVFGSGEGLQGDEFNSGATCRGMDGIFYFGGVNGFSGFRPEEVQDDPHAPTVVLTDLLLFNQPTTPGPEFTRTKDVKPIYAVDELVFSHENKFVTFHFSALHYANPGKNQFAYQLEGFSDWIHTDATERLATFTNIEPGSYTFRVKAANSDGVWNEEGASVKLVVTPPFWKNTWAYLFYGLVAGALILAYLRAEARLKQSLEARVARRTEELKKKNQELDLRYWELASLDDIVVNINREDDLHKLLGALLEQGSVLFPQAERGLFVMRDEDDPYYRVIVSIGYAAGEQKPAGFTYEELKDAYLGEQAQTLGDGIFKTVGTGPAGECHCEAFCYLSIAINWDQHLAGLLVLGMSDDPEACELVDYEKLVRFRQHALSAVAKARAIKKLKDQNEEIMAKQNQLVLQEKMASLGTLAAGVAHELKNPLNFVNGLSQVCVELFDELSSERRFDGEVADNLKKNLAVIMKNGKRANDIVEKMMEMSQDAPGGKQEMDLNRMLREHARLALSGVKARNPDFEMDLVEDLDPLIPELEMVSESLRRVFIHLFNNALESLEEKLAGNAKHRPSLRLKTRLEKAFVEISIWDNGMGVPEEKKARVLDYFYTTWGPDKGHVGLGLPISYDILRRYHGGDLKLESREGEFAEVLITMPLS